VAFAGEFGAPDDAFVLLHVVGKALSVRGRRSRAAPLGPVFSGGMGSAERRKGRWRINIVEANELGFGFDKSRFRGPGRA